MKTAAKSKAALVPADEKTDREVLFRLEPMICDLHLAIDVLFDICHEKLARVGNVTFSGKEAERIYFMMSLCLRESENLKAVYYDFGGTKAA